MGRLSNRDVLAVRTSADPLALLWDATTLARITAVALFVVWALCDPYFEIGASSLIYSGRAMADLDPTGVGRDIMFRLDGQSAFTLFTVLYREVTAAVGPAAATLIVAFASLVASFGGAMILAASLGAGRARALIVIFAAALPAFYGGFKIFSYAEVAATPRPFAEALVLCAMAAIVRGRLGLAASAVAAAAVLHPIMALPGIGVLFVAMVIADRRWLLAVPVCGFLGLLVVVLDPTVATWLGTPMDATWRAILFERSPHLFPSHWPEGWIGRAAARIATLVVAASLSGKPVRVVFLGTVVVGVGGLALSFVSEHLPLAIPSADAELARDVARLLARHRGCGDLRRGTLDTRRNGPCGPRPSCTVLGVQRSRPDRRAARHQRAWARLRGRGRSRRSTAGPR